MHTWTVPIRKPQHAEKQGVDLGAGHLSIVAKRVAEGGEWSKNVQIFRGL